MDVTKQYVSRYKNQIDDLTKEILGREAFSYNPEKDPVYQQYRAAYTRDGQRAMQDTLGQVSARTGGLASSYAGSAAQQTYGNYMAALNDKIPELEQLAYSMYRNEGKDLQDRLSLLTALDGEDYGRYTDLLSRQQRQEETDYSRNATKANLLAAAGDFSGYKALGYSDEEIGKLQAAYGGSGNSNGSVYLQMQEAGITSEADAYDWLLRNGKSSAEAERLSEFYMGMMDDPVPLVGSGDDLSSGEGNGKTGGDYTIDDFDKSSLDALGLKNPTIDLIEKLIDDGYLDISPSSSGKPVLKWSDKGKPSLIRFG